MSNPNVNCLEGMQCPNPDCGSYGPFAIAAKVIVLVSDDGTEDMGGNYDWEESGYCRCIACDQIGTVGDFYTKGEGT